MVIYVLQINAQNTNIEDITSHNDMHAWQHGFISYFLDIPQKRNDLYLYFLDKQKSGRSCIHYYANF